jgi:hypothetical protein
VIGLAGALWIGLTSTAAKLSSATEHYPKQNPLHTASVELARVGATKRASARSPVA